MSSAVVWFEVVGKNGKELQRFYTNLFGWEIEGAQGDASYGLVSGSNGGIGGAVGQSQDGDAGHVTFFVEVDDPAAYLEKVEALGGATVVPPTEIPEYHLTFAYFTDPQGNLGRPLARSGSVTPDQAATAHDVDLDNLPEISDAGLQESLQRTRPYTIVILKAGPRFQPPGPNRHEPVTSIIWAHGKRNFALRNAGIVPIVCPIADGSGVAGVSIFIADPEEVERIMAGDPAVQAGVLTYEVHPTRTFPGSALPT